jgi:ribokinase
MSSLASTSVGVVGSANVDLVVRVRSLPQPGETVLGTDLAQYSGGKGANQAAACATLGATTTFIGAVGNDAHGQWLTSQLESRGVLTSKMSTSSSPTGTALIVVEESGENTIVVASGANNTLKVTGVDIESFDVVVAQLEIPLETVLGAARRANVFILNAAPARELPEELLALCDVVIVNETEAEMVSPSDVRRLVVTLGAKGADYYENGVLTASAQPPKVTPVDTVGAGDTFVGAFAVKYAQGASPSDVLSYATCAGALATLKEGAQGSLPTNEEVLTWLARE